MASIMAMSHMAIYVLLTRTFTGCKFETRSTAMHCRPTPVPPLHSTSRSQSDHTTPPRQCHHALRRTIGLAITPCPHQPFPLHLVSPTAPPLASVHHHVPCHTLALHYCALPLCTTRPMPFVTMAPLSTAAP